MTSRNRKALTGWLKPSNKRIDGQSRTDLRIYAASPKIWLFLTLRRHVNGVYGILLFIRRQGASFGEGSIDINVALKISFYLIFCFNRYECIFWIPFFYLIFSNRGFPPFISFRIFLSYFSYRILPGLHQIFPSGKSTEALPMPVSW